MKILHAMIRVKDPAISMSFYEQLLGLEFIRTKELPDATLYFLRDKKTGFDIELTHNHSLPEDGYSHGNYFGHLAFQVDDINQFTEHLHQLGYDYYREPFTRTWQQSHRIYQRP